MLAIRWRKAGSKKRPFFRVVVTDSRAARDSSFVEVLGFYNPRTAPETLKLDRERFDHWVKQGATASDKYRSKGLTRSTKGARVQRLRPERGANAERERAGVGPREHW